MKKSNYFSAIRISLIYLIISSVYIVFSDYFVLKIFQDSVSPESLSAIQSYKGLGFVFLTALLLFYLIKRETTVQNQYIKLLQEQKRNVQSLLNEKEKVSRELTD